MRGRVCWAFVTRQGCPGLHPRYVGVGQRGADLLDAVQCHRFRRRRCFDDECRHGHFTVTDYLEMLDANGEAGPMPPTPPQQPAQPPWPQPQPPAWERQPWQPRPQPGPQPGGVGANFHEQPQPQSGVVIVTVNGVPPPQPGSVTADGVREEGQPQVEPVPEGQGLAELTKLDLEGLEPGVRKKLAQALLAELTGLADAAEAEAQALPRLHLALNNLQAYLATVAMS